MKNRFVQQLGHAALGVLCGGLAAYAFVRQNYTDQEVVSRAELIVVARVKEGSLTFVPVKSSQGSAWEHRIELAVSEVLKGATSSSPLVVSVDMGLSPIIGGYSSNEFGTVFDFRIRGYPPDIIQIFDTGSSAKPLRCVTGDIRTNHIWLLRRASRGLGASPALRREDVLGIHDPEDVQPVEKREALSAFLRLPLPPKGKGAKP